MIKSLKGSTKITSNLTNLYFVLGDFSNIFLQSIFNFKDEKIRQKHYNKQVTNCNNDNVQSHDQEEIKWSSTIMTVVLIHLKMAK